jgi:photosystem II stability/assembly factor-like uncharacterized protein
MLATGLPVSAQTALELGPAPASGFGGTTGRISAIVCSPTNPNRYFVAGADGGVWRTTDGGATWQPLTDHMSTLAMGALALDPTNENIIYAGTGEANFANHSRYGLGLFKSTDGGDTWVHLGQGAFAGRCISKIIVRPANPQVVYASVTRAGGFPEMAAAKNHPGRNGPVGVFRSGDGGVTWVQLAGGLPNIDATDLAMDPSNPQVLFAAAGRIFGDPENGVYKTTDGGSTWIKLAGGFPTANVGRISIAIAPSLPSRLYAMVTRPSDATGGGASTLGGYRSDDGGTTWTTTALGSIQATYGWYLSCIGVSPTNPDAVLFGGLNKVRSTNGGASFSTVTPPHVDIHAIAFDAAGRLISGNDGGVHRSTNLGTTWTHLNTGLGTIQFYAGLSTHPTNDLVIFGGTQDNGSHRRSTSSLSWTSIAGGDGGWTQVDRTNPLRVFVESQGTGALYRSTDGGNTFNNSGSGLTGRNCFLPPYLIDPQNPQRMLYATERLFLSTNGGTSWTPLSGDLTAGAPAAIRSLAIAPSNPQFVYAATNDHRFLASTDGGVTFQLRLASTPGWPRVTREIAIDPTDPQTVYLATAAFGEPKIRRSRDAGQTWQDLTGSLPDVPINTVGVDTRGLLPVIYAGTDSGLYRSINEGQTWRKYGAGLPNACIIDLLVEVGGMGGAGGRQRIIIGTQGRGAWEVPIVMCYPDMDDTGTLTANDFQVFLNAYAAQSPLANCDRSTGAPVLTANDFQCFLNAFASGCS